MDFATINGKLDALDAAITTERQQFLDTIAAKDATIADLQNQLAGVISPSDGDTIGNRIDASAGNVATIVP